MDNNNELTLPPAIKKNGYSIGPKINQGRFANSVIYSATVEKKGINKKICMKRYVLASVPKDWKKENMKFELKIVKKLRHPYIIKLWDAFKTENSVYIFMDFAPNGSLYGLLMRENKAIEELRAKFWISQILSALCYCHSEGISHRDVKLQCILLDEDLNAILSDFKFGRIKNKEEHDLIRNTSCGTNQYMAPEVNPITKSVPYDARIADMYSFGVCVFQLLNLDMPFDPIMCDTDPKQHYAKQLKRDYRFHTRIGETISKDMKDLVDKLLEPLPGNRYTSDNAIHHKAFLLKSAILN